MGDEKHGLLWVGRKETVIQFTTNFNLARCRLDEAEYQAEHRSLTNARLAHDGSLRACLELMREVRKNLPIALGIAERYVIEADVFILARNTRMDTDSFFNFQFTESVNARRHVNHSWHHVQQLQYRVV